MLPLVMSIGCVCVIPPLFAPAGFAAGPWLLPPGRLRGIGREFSPALASEARLMLPLVMSIGCVCVIPPSVSPALVSVGPWLLSAGGVVVGPWLLSAGGVVVGPWLAPPVVGPCVVVPPPPVFMVAPPVVGPCVVAPPVVVLVREIMCVVVPPVVGPCVFAPPVVGP